MSAPVFPHNESIDLIRLALAEDSIDKDITTKACNLDTHAPRHVRATILAKQKLLACGGPIVKQILELAQMSQTVKASILAQDGQTLNQKSPWIILEGKASDILRIERTILNFLIRMTGIATATNEITQLLSKTGTKVLHTRKTLPGHRALDIYSCLVGGGHPHRKSLADAILVKENHISAVGDWQKLTNGINEQRAHASFVEIEVRDFTELKYALLSKPNRIMLDNFSVEDVAKAVMLFGSSVEFEASGGINRSNVLAYAETGVDFISMGWLTHSAPAADLSMLFDYNV